jgi:uncharacterized membrane protein
MSQTLKSIPMFATLDDQELAQLNELLRPRQYGPHQAIVWIGEPGEEMFVVQSGQVLIAVPGETQAEVVLATLGPGQFFGELSLLDGGPRSATARARNDVTLLSLERKDFYAFVERHPKAAVHILQTLGQRQREMVDRVRGIRNVNEAVAEHTTAIQRVLDQVASFGASGKFLALNLLFILLWMVLHTVLALKDHPDRIIFPIDDPPTFFWLSIIIAIESITLTMFVLNAQKRSAERDRVRADLDYQVNLKAHHEVLQLHRKIDRLEAALGGRRTGDGPTTDTQ